MRKYLVYCENEWPANIAELTAIENKPFVGYLKANKEVRYTDIITGPADNEIWYKNGSSTKSTFACMRVGDTPDDDTIERFIPENGQTIGGYNIISHEYNSSTGWFIIKCDSVITSTFLSLQEQTYYGDDSFKNDVTELYLPGSIVSVCGNQLSTTVRYNGTKDDWGNIEKYPCWFGGNLLEIGDFVTTVYCTDGDVTIS